MAGYDRYTSIREKRVRRERTAGANTETDAREHRGEDTNEESEGEDMRRMVTGRENKNEKASGPTEQEGRGQPSL